MKHALATLLRAAVLLVVGAGLAVLVLANPFDWGVLHPVQHLAGIGGGGPSVSAEDVPEGTLWTCGMHPQVIQDEPGTCPICHMDLTPMASGGGDGQPGAHDHDHAHAAGEVLWTCPMHPDILEDEEGSCPICGMDLVSVEASAPAADEAGAVWTCPMHPEIVEGEPGSCPICGMDLVRKEATPSAAAAGAAEGEILYYRHPHDPSITSPTPAKDEMGMDFVPVRARQGGGGPVVTIDPTVVQNMNVRTTTAERGDVERTFRTVGHFAYDLERMVTVTTKFEGFVEEAHVSYEGQRVRRGQPLFEIYSQELVQTQQELLSALDYARRMQDAPAATRRRAQDLVEAARQRLDYWDISGAQVRRLEETGQIRRTLTVTAPVSGLVMQRPPALEGMAVRPGMEVLHLADLSNLWLETEIYEDQLASIDVGTRARILIEAFPGMELSGRVAFIEPEVSEKTRTVNVTLSIPNPDERIKVGMWATVIFDVELATDVVKIPSQSVLRTGERNVVVVAMGRGRFAPREVLLGAEGQGQVAILSGLEAGDEIVTSAQFLIDSESRLQEAIQKMIAEKRKG